MHIVEEALYKVSCHIDYRDLKMHGITTEDILNRTPLGYMFIQKASQLAKGSTDYKWPGCAFSMQIDLFANDFVLVFSERIDDFLYDWRQLMHTLPKVQADMIEKMLIKISTAEEKEAREIIRAWERNIREG